MVNLGPYQDIVTEAKMAGGVQSLIKIIESKAVSKAAPAISAKGVGAGAALAVGGVVVGKKLLDQRKSDRKAAEEAKAQFASEVAVLGGDTGDNDSQPGSDGDLV